MFLPKTLKEKIRKEVVLLKLIIFLFLLSQAFVFLVSQKTFAETANRLLISEVLYNPSGTESEREWLEIYNPTASDVDLSNYKIGDEESKGGGEGMYQFPAGSKIEARSKLTIALRASGFRALYGKDPDFEIAETSPEVPNLVRYSSWGGGTIALSNLGDEILLLDEVDLPIDVLTYGSGSYEGVIPHPGVAEDYSLERFPVNEDTNDCSRDFRNQPLPNPESGKVTETISPTIFNLKPADDSLVNTPKLTVGADYTDNPGGSGINPFTAKLYLDDEDETPEAVVTDTSISYTPSSALSEGEHTVKVEIKDNDGNPTEVTWTFTVVRPYLSMTIEKVYWANCQDHQKRELSIDFKLSNTGGGNALNTEVKDIAATNGVTVLAPQPISLGTIEARSSKTFTVKYKIPSGIKRFRTILHASYEDDGGNIYLFPQERRNI